MTFKNKAELVNFIKSQTNIKLNNDNSDFNKSRKVLYTQINRANGYSVLPLLSKHNIRFEPHVKDNYFVYIG